MPQRAKVSYRVDVSVTRRVEYDHPGKPYPGVAETVLTFMVAGTDVSALGLEIDALISDNFPKEL